MKKKTGPKKGTKFTSEHKAHIGQALKVYWSNPGNKAERLKKINTEGMHSASARQRQREMMQTREVREKISISSGRGPEHHSWKGGRINLRGWVRIYKPDHPFATKIGYVFEHRLVVEKVLGRYLRPEEVVHHINGIGSDNREENLMLFPNNGAHIRHHVSLGTFKNNGGPRGELFKLRQL